MFNALLPFLGPTPDILNACGFVMKPAARGGVRYKVTSVALMPELRPVLESCGHLGSVMLLTSLHLDWWTAYLQHPANQFLQPRARKTKTNKTNRRVSVSWSRQPWRPLRRSRGDYVVSNLFAVGGKPANKPADNKTPPPQQQPKQTTRTKQDGESLGENLGNNLGEKKYPGKRERNERDNIGKKSGVSGVPVPGYSLTPVLDPNGMASYWMGVLSTSECVADMVLGLLLELTPSYRYRCALLQAADFLQIQTWSRSITISLGISMMTRSGCLDMYMFSTF